MKPFIALCLSLCLTACLEPMAERTVDAGALPDGGSPQCAADGSSCWAPQTYCERQPCTYQFDDAGGLCGGEPIRPSCGCARDAAGAFHQQCTGGCPSLPDGGFELVCLTPNCGAVSCGSGTTCIGFGRCE